MEKNQNPYLQQPKVSPSPEAVNRKLEKIDLYLRSESRKVNEELRKMSPERRDFVGEDFRLIPPEEIYNERERAATRELLKKFFETDDSDLVQQKERARSSTQFELLKTAVFHKYMGGDFFVVRSSRYDDIKHGVDNIIIHQKSGDVICALDEISLESFNQLKGLEIKKSKVEKLNIINKGASLDHGLLIDNGQAKFSRMFHLPIFVLVLNGKILDSSIADFTGNEKNKNEENLFKYLILAIRMQIAELKLNQKDYFRLPNDYRARLESFSSFIDAKYPR